MELKKPHASTLVGRVETLRHGTGWSPTHMWWIKILGGHQKRGVPAQHQAPQPWVPVPGRYIPITSGYKTQQGLTQWKKNFWSPKQFFLKNLHMDLLRLTPSVLPHQWHIRRNWSTWHQSEDRETAFSLTEKGANTIVLFLNVPPIEPQSWQAGAISETPSTWLTLFTLTWRPPEALSHQTYRC